jgi:alpha-tubulin suppressor-like RCC1 family protein
VFAADHEATLAKVRTAVASGLFVCAVMVDGTAQCAGVNNHGQLGDGTTTDRPERFAPVKGLAKVAQLAIGDYHACALLVDRTVSGWGDIEMTGQGDAIQTDARPMMGLRDVVDLVAGPSTMCARMTSGKVSCWCQIGTLDEARDRDEWYAARPRYIPWLAGATKLALGSDYGCAVMATGELACWGNNRDGQLGDGTMTNRRQATPVRW